MKIREAIKILQDVDRKDGNVEIFFDCPVCKVSFAPEVVEVKLTMHAKPVKKQ